MRGIILPLVFAIMLPLQANAVTEITRHAITWTFADDENCGTYANEDPWCIGPVSVVAISPLSTNISGRVQHGSVLNPLDRWNGFDSSFGGSTQDAYIPASNAGRPGGSDLSASNPLVITAGNSLVSTRTNNTPFIRPQIVDASVLTIISSAPSSGSFRPPYSGSDKESHWNVSDIRWWLLPKLQPTASAPSITTLISYLDKLWFDSTDGTFAGREYHPSNNMPDYGRDMAIQIGDASLFLLCDYPQATLEPLMIRLLQIGIDLYGVTNDNPRLLTSPMGGLWMGGGGHGHGRKWPILFTGLMFNDQNILKYADASNYKIFQEEQQYFYVSQEDVDQARYTGDGKTRDPYTVEMIGTPEWGEQHRNQPNRDGANWDADYRAIVSPSIAGHALAAIVMRARGYWKWDAFFDYQDRWALYRTQISSAISSSVFTDEMWNAYRNYTPGTKYKNVKSITQETP
jgi:hypothetical protein